MHFSAQRLKKREAVRMAARVAPAPPTTENVSGFVCVRVSTSTTTALVAAAAEGAATARELEDREVASVQSEGGIRARTDVLPTPASAAVPPFLIEERMMAVDRVGCDCCSLVVDELQTECTIVVCAGRRFEPLVCSSTRLPRFCHWVDRSITDEVIPIRKPQQAPSRAPTLDPHPGRECQPLPRSSSLSKPS